MIVPVTLHLRLSPIRLFFLFITGLKSLDEFLTGKSYISGQCGGIFGIALPLLVYKGIVKEFGFNSELPFWINSRGMGFPSKLGIPVSSCSVVGSMSECQTAAEAEPATLSIAKRAVPEAPSIEEANQIVRGNWLQIVENQHLQYSGNFPIRDILDIGCSVGISTRFLADKFPSAKVTAVDAWGKVDVLVNNAGQPQCPISMCYNGISYHLLTVDNPHYGPSHYRLLLTL